MTGTPGSGAHRIFVAGATGVIGVRLVPLLVAAGHTVAGMTRTPGKASSLRALGAEPVVCDVYDAGALSEAVAAFAPDTIIHQLTDLPDDVRLLPERRSANARIRREGTHNLLAAARAASARRFLAQSVAWPMTGDGGDAVREHESAVLQAGGVVLRYGQFYGPGTYHDGALPPAPRIHVDDAARRTLEALGAPSGIVTIVEEEAGPA
ncbi:MAG TPA: NAD-dependent epimerase/dehydratase family protein [Gemmatimonadaceae bacterium]